MYSVYFHMLHVSLRKQSLINIKCLNHRLTLTRTLQQLLQRQRRSTHCHTPLQRSFFLTFLSANKLQTSPNNEKKKKIVIRGIYLLPDWLQQHKKNHIFPSRLFQQETASWQHKLPAGNPHDTEIISVHRDSPDVKTAGKMYGQEIKKRPTANRTAKWTSSSVT